MVSVALHPCALKVTRATVPSASEAVAASEMLVGVTKDALLAGAVMATLGSWLAATSTVSGAEVELTFPSDALAVKL